MTPEAKIWVVLLILVLFFVIVGNEACQWERIRRMERAHDNLQHWVFDIFHDDFAKGDQP